MILKKVISGEKEGYYLSGTGGAGQYTNYLVGSSIYNKPLPSNVKLQIELLKEYKTQKEILNQ